MKRYLNSALAACVAGPLLTFTISLQGAGFALQEQSVSGLGVAFAGGATSQADNSSMVYNAATLALYNDGIQATSGLHIILPKAEFKNNGSLTGFIPGTSPGVATQGSDATSDKPAVIPNLFVSYPMNENTVLGLSISTPFGLASEYDEGWVGRYVALESELATVQLNFAVGHKISDQLYIGAGVSLLHADAVLSNAINMGLLYLNYFQSGLIPQNAQTVALAGDVQANLGGTKYDGAVRLEGDDFGYGWNIGMLFKASEQTHLGFQYRSPIKLKLSGHADFTVGALDAFFGSRFTDQGGRVALELPDLLNLSVTHKVNEQWTVMADALYTFWSSFDELRIQFSEGVLPDNVIDESWDDVWRFSVGTTYEMSDTVQLRAGLAYDESPVPSNGLRSPRIPDEDRVWLSLGLGWRYSDKLVFDFAYTHIFVDDPVIDNPYHTSGEYLRGSFDATVNIISVGGTYSF